MTAAEKQKTSAFLDLVGDYLSDGYHGTERQYNFKDDEPPLVSAPLRDDPLEQIAEEIRACRACALGLTRTNAAPGEGVFQPLVMVIGEGPGADEDAQGRPFVGKAGQLLDKMLSSINLSRNTNCFIANVVKCRPPGNRNPFPEETAACAHFLERQIALLKPKFILILGKVAAQTLLKTDEAVGKLRGKFMELPVCGMTIPLIVTYHPAYLLRNENDKRFAWEDLKLLRSKLTEAGLMNNNEPEKSGRVN